MTILDQLTKTQMAQIDALLPHQEIVLVTTSGSYLFTGKDKLTFSDSVDLPETVSGYPWTDHGNGCFSRTAPPPSSHAEEVDLLKRRIQAVDAISQCPELRASYVARLAALTDPKVRFADLRAQIDAARAAAGIS